MEKTEEKVETKDWSEFEVTYEITVKDRKTGVKTKQLVTNEKRFYRGDLSNVDLSTDWRFKPTIGENTQRISSKFIQYGQRRV